MRCGEGGTGGHAREGAGEACTKTATTYISVPFFLWSDLVGISLDSTRVSFCPRPEVFPDFFATRGVSHSVQESLGRRESVGKVQERDYMFCKTLVGCVEETETVYRRLRITTAAAAS